MKYKKYLNANYKWVKWITEIDSWKQGKTFWIFAINHGNEPVWLEVFQELEKYLETNNIVYWKILLVAVNIDAYTKHVNNNYDDSYRFIDDNMNRIWNKNIIETSSEWQRKWELLSIFDEIDIALDLHSVSEWNLKMLISDFSQKSVVNSIFDVEYTLFDDIGNTWALISYFLKNNKIWFGIECWNHKSSEAFLTGFDAVKNMLLYYSFTNYKPESKLYNQVHLAFHEEIFPTTNKFKFTKEYNSFTLLNKGEKFASDWEKEYRENTDFDLYIWLISHNVRVWDWAWFLFKKL